MLFVDVDSLIVNNAVNVFQRCNFKLGLEFTNIGPLFFFSHALVINKS